jgi:hypothetical protein
MPVLPPGPRWTGVIELVAAPMGLQVLRTFCKSKIGQVSDGAAPRPPPETDAANIPAQCAASHEWRAEHLPVTGEKMETTGFIPDPCKW